MNKWMITFCDDGYSWTAVRIWSGQWLYFYFGIMDRQTIEGRLKALENRRAIDAARIPGYH